MHSFEELKKIIVCVERMVQEFVLNSF